MLGRFARFAPTAVVRAFIQSMNTEVGMANTIQLLCSYLHDETNAQLLLENGLLDAISSRMTGSMSEEVRVCLLRVLYELCSTGGSVDGE